MACGSTGCVMSYDNATCYINCLQECTEQRGTYILSTEYNADGVYAGTFNVTEVNPFFCGPQNGYASYNNYTTDVVVAAAAASLIYDIVGAVIAVVVVIVIVIVVVCCIKVQRKRVAAALAGGAVALQAGAIQNQVMVN